MKKLISFCILFFIALTLKAQTQEETLEWLRTKQQTIRNAKLTIDDSAVKVSDSDNALVIPWSKVKDVTQHLSQITIVSNELADGKNLFIRFSIEAQICDKYIKALKHMAALKGAKLVNEDLF